MIMDYMIMHWDDFDDAIEMVRNDHALGDQLPNDVVSAMELLRYEKIGRWQSKNWDWVDDPQYDREALKIAEGKKDRRKQDALYVRIGRDGRVVITPHAITDEETRTELERANRYGSFVESVLGGDPSTYRYEKAIVALKFLFADRG